MKYAIAMCVLAAGCAPTFGEPIAIDVLERAGQAWEAHGFEFSAQCQFDAASGRVTLAYASSAEEMEAYCGERWPAGCTLHAGGHTSIAILATLSEREQARALEHELRHWLLACSSGDSDHDHVHPGAWYAMPDGSPVLAAGDGAR